MEKKSGILQIFNFKPTQSSRFGWIDYAKGIAIILVVYRHVDFGLKRNGMAVTEWILNLNDMFYSFRMPLFFILSGLFFQKSLAKKSTKGFVLQKVNTLLYPYILWSIIQLTLQLIFHDMVNAQRMPSDYLNILLQPRANDQLWYLFALFNVTILYLILSIVFRHNHYLHFITAFVFLALAPFANSISGLYDVMVHYIFFCIGNVLATSCFNNKVQAKLSSGKALLLLFPVFVLFQYYFLYHQHMNLFLFAVIAVTGSLFTIMLSFFLDKHQLLSFLKVIGNNSLYIYVLHVPIIALFRYFIFMHYTINNPIWMVIILIIIGIFSSMVVYRICQLLGLQFLFTGPFKLKKPVKAIKSAL